MVEVPVAVAKAALLLANEAASGNASAWQAIGKCVGDIDLAPVHLDAAMDISSRGTGNIGPPPVPVGGTPIAYCSGDDVPLEARANEGLYARLVATNAVLQGICGLDEAVATTTDSAATATARATALLTALGVSGAVLRARNIHSTGRNDLQGSTKEIPAVASGVAAQQDSI